LPGINFCIFVENTTLTVKTSPNAPSLQSLGWRTNPGILGQHAASPQSIHALQDWETHTIRRSFTCQFHPELMANIRNIGKRERPRYAELEDNDGVRLLIRLLYHGMLQ
jgi:hypothetical protein